MTAAHVLADVLDQSPGDLFGSEVDEAKAPSSKLTWDLLPTPGKYNIDLKSDQ